MNANETDDQVLAGTDRLPLYARRLLWERKRRGWSRPQLRTELRATAKRMHESEPRLDLKTIRRWETGGAAPGPYYIRLLCALYETTADRLGLIRGAGDLGLAETGPTEPSVDAEPGTTIADAAGNLRGSPIGALAVAGSVTLPEYPRGPARTDESMRRRAFARYLAFAGGAAALHPDALAAMLMRIGRQLEGQGDDAGSAGLTDTAADHAQRRITGYMEQWDKLPPHVLLQAVVEEAQAVLAALDHPPDRRLAQRLHVIASETLCFAGLLCWYMQQRATAEFYLSLADEHAEEAGHGPVEAMVLLIRADFHSKVQIGRGQGSAISRSMLDAAAKAAGRGPSVIRAWLLLRQAEEFAVIGDGRSCNRCLDSADSVFSAVGSPPPGLFAHWSMDMHHAFRGNCEQLLRRYGSAVATLSEVLERMDPLALSNRIALQTDIAAVLARQGEVDEACALLSTALVSAVGGGLRYRIHRIAGIRRVQLAGRDAEAAVRRFDEQMSAIV